MLASRVRISVRVTECHQAPHRLLTAHSVSVSSAYTCSPSTRQQASGASARLGGGGLLIIGAESSFCKQGRRASIIVRGVIKAVENYDAGFELEPDSQRQLDALLSSPVFCAQVEKMHGCITEINGITLGRDRSITLA